jgi:asparagine synthase (glutamine-hydrolysing)
MCGIAGIFRVGGGADTAPLSRMVEVLHHRGPDDQHQVELPQGALGVARLAIVDRPGGRQPLSSGETWVAMNGEVYNHAVLRKELVAHGAEFSTESDTEVLAALNEELGTERGLLRCEGHFGVALVRGGRLTLVRDRMGQKPLYWTQLEDGTLLFGSELKSLLVHPSVPRELDPVALEEYLLFEYIPAPRTIYRGIHKLEAGTLLELDEGGLRLRRWWTPPLPSGIKRHTLGVERWQMSVRTSLRMAVRKRVDTDLPVAVLLSGGVDSSAVAVLAKEVARSELHSFSMGFEEASFDESGPARQVAEHLGLPHTALSFSPHQLPEALEAIGGGLCEPLADGSLPATWLLARGVHEAGFKLAISGDGADEHFGGYPTYMAHRLAAPARWGGGLLSRVARRLPSSRENLGTGYKARRFSAGLDLPLARRNQVWLGAFLPSELPALLGRAGTPWETVDRWGRVVEGLADPAEQAMFLDQRLYLGEGVLTKADRAAMLSSVELRSPFLDHRVIELVAEMPTELKIRRRQTKVLLRSCFEDALPASILARPKKGFGVPLAHWLAGPCAHLLHRLPERLEGTIAPQPVRDLLAEHQAGRRDHRRRIWTLLVLARWLEGPWGPRG